MKCRCKQAEILAGVCGQREALERRVYEQDVQLELSLDELETSVQVQQQQHMLLDINSQVHYYQRIIKYSTQKKVQIDQKIQCAVCLPLLLLLSLSLPWTAPLCCCCLLAHMHSAGLWLQKAQCMLLILLDFTCVVALTSLGPAFGFGS